MEVQVLKGKCIDFCRHPIFFDYLCKLVDGSIMRVYTGLYDSEGAWWFSDPAYAKRYFDFYWSDFDAYGEDVEVKLCKKGDMAVLSINVMPGRVFVFRELAEYKSTPLERD